jgi:hypothetical protein
MSAPAINSTARNNLFYLSAAGHSTVVNKGTGNTISNNSVSPNGNPGFTNASGAFDVITDFKPTTNYSGATTVPVWYDALGVLWSSPWELGAVHP